MTKESWLHAKSGRGSGGLLITGGDFNNMNSSTLDFFLYWAVFLGLEDRQSFSERERKKSHGHGWEFQLERIFPKTTLFFSSYLICSLLWTYSCQICSTVCFFFLLMQTMNMISKPNLTIWTSINTTNKTGKLSQHNI